MVDVVELSEWADIHLPGTSLTAADRHLAEQLGSSRRLYVDELLSGVRIRSQSWVGLVRFDGFDVRIIPKLADGNARLIQILALTGGIKPGWQSGALRTLDAQHVPDLLDLLTILLARESERILAQGVLHDYIEREEALGVVRGRFLVDRQWRRRFGQFQQLECRFDEHDSDIDENRLLSFTFGMCRSGIRNRGVLRRVRRLHEQFGSVCESDYIDPKEVRTRLVYHRLNSHYEDAHALCWLILRAMGVADLLASGSIRSNLFLIDMNLLFEQFVHKFLEFCVGGHYRVDYQTKTRSVLWDADRNRAYSAVIPDFHLVGKQGNLVVDAKYKLRDKMDTSDLYQGFLYAQAFGAAEELPSRSILIVPSQTRLVEHSRVEVRSTQGIRKSLLHLVGIPLAAAVDEMQADIRGPITEAVAAVISQTVGDGV
jgi:5-methylcytosine-specific restriction enzyme subunit McrC